MTVDSDDELLFAFAGELRERVAALDRRLEELELDPESGELGAAARAEAHRLKGAAATLRLESLAAAAAAAEELAKAPAASADEIRRARAQLGSAAAAIERPLVVPDAPVRDGGPGRPLTVLQIEDNVPNARLLERFLSRDPAMTVLTATTGEHGLELARERRPDVVLLDLGLPDLDGEEVLSRLHSDPATAGVPVVIVSADASPADTARLRAADVREYFVKPLELARLLETLRAIAAEDWKGH